MAVAPAAQGAQGPQQVLKVALADQPVGPRVAGWQGEVALAGAERVVPVEQAVGQAVVKAARPVQLAVRALVARKNLLLVCRT